VTYLSNFCCLLLPPAFPATGIVYDDDPPPTLTAADVRVTEGEHGTTMARVLLQANQPIYADISYSTMPGTALAPADYTATAGVVAFANQEQKEIEIPIIGDTQIESDDRFTLHLAVAELKQPIPVELLRPDVTVTIVNDDMGFGPATQSIPLGAHASLTLNLGSAPPAPVAELSSTRTLSP